MHLRYMIEQNKNGLSKEPHLQYHPSPSISTPEMDSEGWQDLPTVIKRERFDGSHYYEAPFLHNGRNPRRP